MTPVRARLTINKDKKCFPWHIDMNLREVDLCGRGESRIRAVCNAPGDFIWR